MSILLLSQISNTSILCSNSQGNNVKDKITCKNYKKKIIKLQNYSFATTIKEQYLRLNTTL